MTHFAGVWANHPQACKSIKFIIDFFFCMSKCYRKSIPFCLLEQMTHLSLSIFPMVYDFTLCAIDDSVWMCIRCCWLWCAHVNNVHRTLTVRTIIIKHQSSLVLQARNKYYIPSPIDFFAFDSVVYLWRSTAVILATEYKWICVLLGYECQLHSLLAIYQFIGLSIAI